MKILSEKQLQTLENGREIGRKIAWETNRGRLRTLQERQNISNGKRNFEREKIICDLYKNKMPSTEIAKKLNISVNCVCRILRENNIHIRGKRESRLQDIDIKIICEQYKSGETLSKLLKENQISYPCLKNILNSNDIMIDSKRRRPNKGNFGKKENHFNWQGGISKLPYPFNFDEELKNLIRKRDNYKCQLCGCPQEECYEKLHIHHIDYDKDNLNPKNLISLCRSCHSKTIANRNYWINYFQKLMGVKNARNVSRSI